MSELNGEAKLLRGNRAIKILAISLVFVLILGSIAILVSVPPASDVPAHISYTSHVPISIIGNSGFLGPNASTGVNRGNGTESNPYVIEGWEINATIENCIDIRGVEAFFVITNCHLHNIGPYYDGIHLEDCRNGTLRDNNCSNNVDGIYLLSSENITVTNNTCSSTFDEMSFYYGIIIVSSGNNIIDNNTCSSNNGDGICLSSSQHNTINDNICDSNKGEGIHLSSSSNNSLNRNTCAFDYRGICLYLSNDNDINNNTCGSNRCGIYLGTSCNNSAYHNVCNSNTADGIYLESISTQNSIYNNSCGFNNENGISLFSSSNNDFCNNTIESNNLFGIFFGSSSNDRLSGNILSNDGIYIESDVLSHWNTHEIDTLNLVNGKPVYYFKNQIGMTISNDAGQIILANCTEFTIKDQLLDHTDVGILLGFSSNNLITNTSCNSSRFGIFLVSSHNNTLYDNKYSNNVNGINLYSSNNNIISQNELMNNTNYSNNTDYDFGHGISINSANNNIISQNELMNNTHYGIYINSGTLNIIWNNSLFNNNGALSTYNVNHIQACDFGVHNWWNSSSKFGNYWSDWLMPDTDINGFVDIPYDISGSVGAKDYFPLTLLTTASLSGTLGINDWFRSAVSVSLTVTNAGSGANTTFYRIGTSGSWSDYSSSFVLPIEGNSTVQFYSRDNAGNNETVKSIVIKIDSVKPTLTILTANNTMFSTDQVNIDLNASDETSGLYYFEFAFDGSDYFSNTSIANHTYTISGQVGGQLADGAHYVIIRFVDKAGNVNETRLDFNVHKSTSLIAGIPDWLLFVIIVIVIAALLASVLLMRKKRSPPTRLDEMKAEPPESA